MSATTPKAADAALVPELRNQLTTKTLLPAVSTIAIHVSTMKIAGDLATIQATVTGPEPGTFALLLQRVSGQWLVYGTKQL